MGERRRAQEKDEDVHIMVPRDARGYLTWEKGDRRLAPVGGMGQAACIAGQTHAPPREEGTDLTGFNPSRDHEFLGEVYGDHLHQNNGTCLDRGVADDDLCQNCWKRLYAN